MTPDVVPPDQATADLWLSVSDDLIRGLTHALNNRFAAIASLARLVSDDGTGASPLLAALSKEIDTLERSLRLLRWLPSNPKESAEPVRLRDLMPEILELHRLSGVALDLEFDVRSDGDTPALWVEPVRLAHALLLLLNVASRLALANQTPVVQIRVSGDDEVVSVVLGASLAARADRGVPACTPLEVQLVRLLLGSAGGELVEGDAVANLGSGQITLRLPTLLAIRKREGR
jgi:hypothetical protein